MPNIIDAATEFCRDFEDGLGQALAVQKAVDFVFEEIRETDRAMELLHHNLDDEGIKIALEEVIDGFGDVAFVAINGIYKTFRWLGDSHESATDKTYDVLKRICNANLAKRQPDGTVKKENNKVVKPEGWTAPSYGDLITEG